MGHDGRDGAGHIVRAGGRVIAQDESTSVVWGMPGAVATAGHAEAVKPLKDLSALALRMMNGEAA
jgi:two-component system chemotaxis response regulator CheB